MDDRDEHVLPLGLVFHDVVGDFFDVGPGQCQPIL